MRARRLYIKCWRTKRGKLLFLVRGEAAWRTADSHKATNVKRSRYLMWVRRNKKNRKSTVQAMQVIVSNSIRMKNDLLEEKQT